MGQLDVEWHGQQLQSAVAATAQGVAPLFVRALAASASGDASTQQAAMKRLPYFMAFAVREAARRTKKRRMRVTRKLNKSHKAIVAARNREIQTRWLASRAAEHLHKSIAEQAPPGNFLRANLRYESRRAAWRAAKTHLLKRLSVWSKASPQWLAMWNRAKRNEAAAAEVLKTWPWRELQCGPSSFEAGRHMADRRAWRKAKREDCRERGEAFDG
eukprot:8160909-Alexandrium_andersonii.AAC.1